MAKVSESSGNIFLDLGFPAHLMFAPELALWLPRVSQ